MNPAEFLTISSAVLPDREALVSGDGANRVTYEQMASRVLRLANALQSHGVEQGHRVGDMATNSPEYVEVYYACARLGACFVPLNFRAKREELAHMLNASEMRVLFVGTRYIELLNSVRNEATRLEHVFALEGEADGLASFETLIQGASEEEMWVDIDEGEATALIF